MRPARVLLGCLGSAALMAAAGVLYAAMPPTDVIVLGASISLSGKYAENGTNAKNGYDLAIREINNAGGVTVGGKVFKLQIRYYDDASIPARGTELAERLIRQDNVRFLLGPYSSGLTKAMLPVVEKYRVPMVEANGAARELFAKGYRYIFAVLSTSDQYLTPVIDLAAERAGDFGKRPEEIRIALAMENDPFAQDVRMGVLDDAERHRMQVVIDDQLAPELDDMSMTLTKVKALKPDLLIVSGHENGALTALSQIHTSRVYVPMLAMTHCDSAHIVEKLGKVAEHTLCAQQWHESLPYRDPVFGSAGDFAKLFRQSFGYRAPYQAAQSAAAVKVFAEAFNRAQSLDPEKVRDALAATDVETFFAPVRFDEAGRNVAKSMVLTQVQGGKYVVVFPARNAQAKPIIPRQPH